MADHYYSAQPEAAHEYRTVKKDFGGEELVFKTDAGVFSKAHVDPGSLLLIEAVKELSGRVLDLGCGYGPVGIALAKEFPDVSFVLTDVNDRAVDLCRENIAANGVLNAEALSGDGCSALTGTFSAVVSNPPIRVGKEKLHEMWTDCHALLEDGGQFYIVIRKKQGAPSAAAFLTELFGNCETVARGGGYHVLKSVK